MKKCLSTLFLFLSAISLWGQARQIKGDTAYWFRLNQQLIEETQLTDLNTAELDFCLRFSDHNQIVELVQSNGRSSGTITNYTYWTKNDMATRELLFQTDTLSSGATDSIIQYYQNQGIAALPSDKDIGGWSHGLDGTIYIVEDATNSIYHFKNYWTPSIQDSLPEATLILNFIEYLNLKIQLSKRRNAFFTSLHRNGCYTSGSMGMQCTANPRSSLGLSAATQLPFGVMVETGLTYIGKTYVSIGMRGEIQVDLRGNHSSQIALGKSNLLLNRAKKASDFLNYTYANKQLGFRYDTQPLINHQIMYGSGFNNLSLSAGVDIDKGLRNASALRGSIGFTVFKKVRLWSNASFFKYSIDAEFGAQVHFNPFRYNNRNPMYGNLKYKRYLDYEDLNLGIGIVF